MCVIVSIVTAANKAGFQTLEGQREKQQNSQRHARNQILRPGLTKLTTQSWTRLESHVPLAARNLRRAAANMFTGLRRI